MASLALALAIVASIFGVASFFLSLYLLVKYKALPVRSEYEQWEPVEVEDFIDNFDADPNPQMDYSL